MSEACPNCQDLVVEHTNQGCAHCACPLTREAAMRSLAVEAAILNTRE